MLHPHFSKHYQLLDYYLQLNLFDLMLYLYLQMIDQLKFEVRRLEFAIGSKKKKELKSIISF